MASKIITEELKNQIITEYQQAPISLAELSVKYNLCQPTISKILKDIPRYKKADIFSPQLDHNFFNNIDTEEKAYFIGLLIADGNVFKDKTGRQASISITLLESDKYILERFKYLLRLNTSITKDNREDLAVCSIAARSDIIANDLLKYGIAPRKTYNTYLPELDHNLMPHLFRGLLDGDGSILAKQNGIRFLHSFSFCGTHKLMQDVSDYLFDNLSLNIKPKVYDYKNKSLSEIKIQNLHDIKIFGEWIYNNSSIYLVRKKDLYDKIISHYQDNTELTE